LKNLAAQSHLSMRTKVMIYSPMRMGVHWDSPWYRSHPGVSLRRKPETGIRSSRYHGARRGGILYDTPSDL